MTHSRSLLLAAVMAISAQGHASDLRGDAATAFLAHPHNCAQFLGLNEDALPLVYVQQLSDLLKEDDGEKYNDHINDIRSKCHAIDNIRTAPEINSLSISATGV